MLSMEVGIISIGLSYVIHCFPRFSDELWLSIGTWHVEILDSYILCRCREEQKRRRQTQRHVEGVNVGKGIKDTLILQFVRT